MTNHLTLLGKPTLSIQGTAITRFRSQKSLVLLAYLIERERPLRRVELAELFWPHLPKPLIELRRTLHDLNQHAASMLTADRTTVAFTVGTVKIDLQHFQQYLATGTEEALLAALDLYRGDFLETVTVDDSENLTRWLESMRERWREAYIQVLQSLIARTQTRRDFEASIRFARRLVEFAPWREENQRLLIDLLSQSGQPDAALRQYELLREQLQVDLMVVPNAQTEQLIERVRTGGERVQASAETHAAAYLAFARFAHEHVEGTEQLQWLYLLDSNNNHLRDALFWSLKHDPETACRLCQYLWLFWRWRAHVTEGYEWLQQALAVGDGVVSAELLGTVEWAAAMLATVLQKDALAIAHLERCLALHKKMQNQRGIARALIGLGSSLSTQQNQGERAIQLQKEGLAIYQTMQSDMGLWYANNALGETHRILGQLDKSVHFYKLSQRMAQKIDNKRSIAIASSNLGAVALLEERYHEARSLVMDALAGMLDVGDEINVAQCIILSAGIRAALHPSEQPVARGWLITACNYIASLNMRMEVADKTVVAKSAELCGYFLPDPLRPRFVKKPNLPTLNEAVAQVQDRASAF